MKLAFLLFKYFPFGGAQRDCLKVASRCAEAGHDVTIYTRTWQGDRPSRIKVELLNEFGLTNFQKDRSFIARAQERIKADIPDGVIGFNRMPGLDVYFCADSCWQEKIACKPGWKKLLPRYRYFLEMEKAVFARGNRTEILMLTSREIPLYEKYYGTEQRFHVLPPGITRHPYDEAERINQRISVRAEFGWDKNSTLLLFVGSGFRTKGLHRAIQALATLPGPVRENVRFAVVGQGSSGPYERLARNLGIERQVHFLGGRSDVRRFYLAADCLIHPAINENTGTVLLEALEAGLPVLTTSACGYAFHVEKAAAGIVLAEPFEQSRLDEALGRMLVPTSQSAWRASGLAYAATEDLYSQHQKAVEIIERVVSEKVRSKTAADQS